MSATVIPDLMPSRRTSWPGSSASSRSYSSCQIGLTMSATGRSAFGKAAAGTPDGAMKSCAPAEIVNAAAKDESSSHSHDYGPYSDAEWTSRGERQTGGETSVEICMLIESVNLKDLVNRFHETNRLRRMEFNPQTSS